MGEKVTANRQVIQMWAKRDKCWMCKHRFSQPVLLPAEKPERGKFQPNINTDVLWHLYDTHGIPADVTSNWIIGSVYGLKLHEFGAEGLQGDTT